VLVRTFLVAALTTATLATVPTGAQAALTRETERVAFAPDLRGTITITTESVAPGGASKRSFVLTARGAADQTSWVPVDAAVATYDMTYLVYDPETDAGVCHRETFLGWSPAENGPPGEGHVRFDTPALNLATGRAKAYVWMIPGEPFGRVGHSLCGGGTYYEENLPLVASFNHLENPPSLLGQATGDNTQEAGFSPAWMTLTRDGDVWRSKGSHTSTDTSFGTRTVTVSWDVWSTRPSNMCAVPKDRLVRGRTVSAAQKVLRKYGFPRRRVERAVRRGFPPGRVFGVTPSDFSDVATCGARLTLYVAR
jgi:hypothetical protein